MRLRAAAAGDLEPLLRILSEPEVARWWPGFDRARVQAELLAPDPEVTVFVLEHQAQVIGAIQYGEVSDPQYRHASVDLFLGRDWWGRGFGPEAIRTLLAHLVRDRGHHRVVIDPAADNTRAIRAYGKVGFRRVGLLRQYERGADGRWHDGLLMELLADELDLPA
ncbi:MAG: GNAT family N-acetyltransferase [Myxococcales bacterium]